MDLTIVIVNWNGGEFLLRCLRSIRESRTSFEVRVIVVDNDSRDGSRELAQRQFAEFHIFNSGANLGFGKANNLARPRVTTPLVLFLNPDTELKPDTLERMVQLMMAKPDVGAAGCKMRYLDGGVQEQGLQWYPTPITILLEPILANRACRRLFRPLLPRLDPLRSAYVRKLYGGFMMVRKEALDRAGWFDDRYFMYAEDVDLSRTIRFLGWELFYCAEAEILHVCGATSEKAPSGFSLLMKNDSIAKYMCKYYGWIGVALFRLVVGVSAVFRMLLGSLLCMVRQGTRARQRLFTLWCVFLWAVGLKRPFVAESPRATEARLGAVECPAPDSVS